MSITLSITLIIGALFTFLLVIRKIRKSELTIADSTFWIVFAFCVLLIAIFPQIAYFFSDLIGIESPVNFVFLVVIAVLVVREFYMTVAISQLRSRLSSLVQMQALNEERKHSRNAYKDDDDAINY